MIKTILLKNTNETALAKALDMHFAGQFGTFTDVADVDDMAVESDLVAFNAAYGPLLMMSLLPAPEPRSFLKPTTAHCATKADDFFNITPHPKLTTLYGQTTFDSVSQQLAAGGYRLAALLNSAFR